MIDAAALDIFLHDRRIGTLARLAEQFQPAAIREVDINENAVIGRELVRMNEPVRLLHGRKTIQPIP